MTKSCRIIVNHFWEPNEDCMKQFQNPVYLNVTSNLDIPGYIKERDYKNISDLNSSLCEITSAWMVRNNEHELGLDDVDYIGLNHYRRFYLPQQVAKVIDEHTPDIICTTPAGIGYCHDIAQQYHLAHNAQDFKMLHDKVARTYDEFTEQTWQDWATKLPYLPAPCNLLVMKKELFNEWVDELDKIFVKEPLDIDLSGRDNYQKRALSFLAERFTSYWTFVKSLTLNVWQIPHEFHQEWKPQNAWDKRGSFDTKELF